MNIKNPRIVRTGVIDVDLFIAEIDDFAPFTVIEGDEIYTRVINGEFGELSSPNGYMVVDGIIVPTSEKTTELLEARRKEALRLIADKHTEMLILATGNVTSAERETWVIQEAAALDVLAGGTGGGVLRPKRGETLHDLAVKIVGEDGYGGKADAYRKLVGIANEIKRNAEQDVEELSLQTHDDLAQLDQILATAIATADAFMAQVTNSATNTN